MRIEDRLAAWQEAGLIDEAAARRIAAYEARRSPAAENGDRITLGEVLAYVGSVVLLIGIGFLYGTEYATLGSGGRLALIGLVVLGSLAAGAVVQRAGATQAAGRARAAGWAVGALGVAAWFGQAFVDWHVLTRPSPYAGAPPDTSGAIMLATAVGLVVSAALLWRSGAWLVAFASAALGYSVGGAFASYAQIGSSPWAGELTWLVPGSALVVLSETLTRHEERRQAREVLRFAAVVPPALAALVFSGADSTLELFAGFLSVAALGAAILRGSAGYALAGGVGLFALVNEVGFRHFARSVGFPVVLIASGITLLAVAAGLFRLLPLLTRRRYPNATRGSGPS
jgi:hypothetical protein